MILDPDLPDELLREDEAREPTPDEKASLFEHWQRIGKLIGGKRDAAVKARKESGIEDVWTGCEERYSGIDDMNRGQGQSWRKPTNSSGPLTRNTSKQDDARSTVFVRLTTRYVDMGAAKVKEKALPIDDKPFGLKPTPVAELIQALPEVPAVPGAPSTDPSAETDAVARKGADKAAKRIYDWMTKAKYPTHIRKMIDDGARLGTGILKGPFPDTVAKKAYVMKDGVGELVIKHLTFPGVTWVDPWNFFPAGNCGEDIHRGDHVLERDFMSATSLLALKKVKVAGKQPDTLEPVYLADQIDLVIEEGPDGHLEDQNGRRDKTDRKGLFTVWHFFGQLGREDMIALNAVGADELPDDCVSCHAIVTMVNETVIRAQFNPLEKTGHFPYRVFQWSRRAGHWAGVGVGEQVMVPQNMVNAGTRAWLNNAGISSGVQLIINESALRPMDQSFVIGGGIKLWTTTAEWNGDDVRKLMAAIAIPNMGQELFAILTYAFKLAEEMSNIPLISQGQTSDNDPQTFGQAELQNSNANTLLRQIGENLDGQVIEPMVDDYYEWLLLDPDVPADEKGEYDILASGCSAMVEKAIQEQTLMAMAGMALNPAYGWSPKRIGEEIARSKRLDPARISLTPEEIAQAQSQPPPRAPAVEAAEIRERGAMERERMKVDASLQKVKIDTDRDAAYEGYLTERERINAQARRDELMLKREVAMLEMANKRDMTLEQIRADMAKTALELRTQIQLSGGDGKGPQVATPAIEPEGRAPEGRAFQA